MGRGALSGFVAGLLIGVASVVLTSGAVPGSAEDPVVTRSYLESSFTWQRVPLMGEEVAVELRPGGELVVAEAGENFTLKITPQEGSFLELPGFEERDIRLTGVRLGRAYMWLGEEPIRITFAGKGRAYFRRGKVE